MTDEDRTRISECMEALAVIGRDLPTQINLRMTARWSKLPGKVISINVAMRYRVVELGTASVEAFQQGKAIVGATTARAVFETMALLHHLVKKVKAVVDEGKVGEIDEWLMKALAGSKHERDKEQNYPYEAVNVLTSIQGHLEKELKGASGLYSTLCESTHPNFFGLVGAYAKIGAVENEILLGPSSQISDMLLPGLAFALKGFILFDNRLSDSMIPFIKVCDIDAEEEMKKGPIQ